MHHEMARAPPNCMTLAGNSIDQPSRVGVAYSCHLMRTVVRPEERLVFLDALRGIASLSVAMFHIYAFSAIGRQLGLVLPRWADTALRHGGVGVDVFFVISGIAIAASVGTTRITGRYMAQFALRRSIRLDPPYWATLGLAVAILTVDHRPPTLGRVLAHLVYAQTLIGDKNIVSVFWTLTYEVQFYLFFVFVMLLGQRMGRKAGWAMAIVPFLTSLIVPILGLETGGWFILWWYAFAAGVATIAMLNGRLSPGIWIVALILIAATECFVGSLNHISVSITALALGLLGLARGRPLASWNGGRVLQWLGRRSYSLYLIHFVGAALAKTLSPRINDAVAALVVFAMAVSVSVVCAEVLYRAIEAPAHRLSRSVVTLWSEEALPIAAPITVDPAVDHSVA